ncbi:MAG: hypothetical protein ABMA15_10385 [Vicinamibacterales bacterium]
MFRRLFRVVVANVREFAFRLACNRIATGGIDTPHRVLNPVRPAFKYVEVCAMFLCPSISRT